MQPNGGPRRAGRASSQAAQGDLLKQSDARVGRATLASTRHRPQPCLEKRHLEQPSCASGEGSWCRGAPCHWSLALQFTAGLVHAGPTGGSAPDRTRRQAPAPHPRALRGVRRRGGGRDGGGGLLKSFPQLVSHGVSAVLLAGFRAEHLPAPRNPASCVSRRRGQAGGGSGNGWGGWGARSGAARWVGHGRQRSERFQND